MSGEGLTYSDVIGLSVVVAFCPCKRKVGIILWSSFLIFKIRIVSPVKCSEIEKELEQFPVDKIWGL